MIDTQAIRSKILDLAMRGKLTEQLPEDGTAEELYRRIQEDKQVLIHAGKSKKSTLPQSITKDIFPFDIPKSWKWARFGELGQLKSGFAFKSSEYTKEGIQVVRISDLSENAIGSKDAVFYPLTDGLASYLVVDGSFLICMTGSIGKMAWVKDGVLRYLNQRVGMFIPSAQCVPEYLWFFLHEAYVIKEWIRAQRSTNGNIRNSDITDLAIPLPPLAEQHRIVTRIEQAFSALDTIDALQAKYADNLAVLKSKLIDAAIQGKLTDQLPEDGTAEELYRQIQAGKQALIKSGKIKKGKPLPEITADEIPFEIPANWKWVRVGSVAEVAGGTTPKSSEICTKGTIPYFKVSDMNTAGNETHMIHASNFISKGYTGRIFPVGTTIFPKNGGSALTNKRRILVVPSAVDLNTGGCTPVLFEMTDWVRLFMDTIDFGEMDTGSNIPTVNATNLKNQYLPLPPLAEQKRIVKRVSELLAVCDELKAHPN